MKKTPTELEQELADAIATLRKLDFDDPKYDKTFERVEKLQAAVANEKRAKEKKLKIDPNEMVKMGISVLELMLVLGAEEFRPILSKGFGLIVRPRV